MENSFLVAGLGNPGKEYALTRHNAGFLVLQKFGERLAAAWRDEPKFRSLVARANLADRKVILCQPQTYMNSSGTAVADLAQFFKIGPENVLAVVDDADLPFGQIRLRIEGSSGGHHGLESIQAHLGTQKFARLRVGIGRTASNVREITGHVLGRFEKGEIELLDKVLERASGQIECFIAEGALKAMNQFNGAVVAPAKKEEK